MTDRSELDILAARLDAYGADLARWPAAEADETARLLAVSSDARARLQKAKRFDALVAEAADAREPNGFAFRVVAEVDARRRDRFIWLEDQFSWAIGSPGRFGLASASFCAAALAVGLALGAIVGPIGALAQPVDLGDEAGLSLLDGDV